MDKVSQFIKDNFQKLNAMSIRKKIAFGIILIGMITAIILFAGYTSTNKYGILFSNLSATDAKIVMDNLKTQKVDAQVKGNTIYVPKAQVDSLRLTLASGLTNGSKGYDLLDTGNQFGMSDSEFNIKKLEATQGEFERTIKSFPQVENARVHLTLQADTTFVQDTNPAKASVYLQLKPGMKLTTSQVKAIIALLTGGVQGLDKKNVDIIDDNLTLLSAGIYDGSNDTTSSTSIADNQATQSAFETKLQNNIKSLLEPALGSGKVNVKVNADLDFNSNEKTVIAYDPSKVIVSSHIISGDGSNSNSAASQSPVDNNSNNTTPTTGTTTATANGGVTTTTTSTTSPNSSTSTSGTNSAPGVTITPINPAAAAAQTPSVATANGSTTTSTTATTTKGNVDETYNYNIGQTQVKTLSAPGQVKRITASVMVDGVLDSATTSNIQKAVSDAIGYSPARGDEINVLAMTFDPVKKAADTAAIQALKAQSLKAQNMQLYKTIGVVLGSGIALILFIILIIKLLRKPEEQNLTGGLDAIIGETILPKTEIEYAPLNLEAQANKNSMETEIKKYATDKPDQVADIIKSWIAEDER